MKISSGVRGRERGLNDSTYDSVSPSLNQVESTSPCFARVLNHVVPGDTSRCFRTLVRDNPSILIRAHCTCKTYTCTDGQNKCVDSFDGPPGTFTPIGSRPVPNAVPGATNASELIWSSLRGYVHNPHSPLRHGRPQSRYEAGLGRHVGFTLIIAAGSSGTSYGI